MLATVYVRITVADIEVMRIKSLCTVLIISHGPMLKYGLFDTHTRDFLAAKTSAQGEIFS